ncbi:MAG: tagatose 1,6-diphosphate aldolase [Dehalococcoidales bacterium]|jgi:tagatose 1,6-diphosphate aldolase
MNRLSIGKLRGLQQLADDRGILTICAIDHRGALKRALNGKDPNAVSYQDMVDFKIDLCRAMAPLASAVLLDPLYGAAQAIAAGVLPGHLGLLVSLEKTGYTGTDSARLTELLPGWSVKKVKKAGASACKLLIYFRPDSRDTANRQMELVDRLAGECREEDIPLLLEPVSYPLTGEGPEEFARKKPELVIETARRLTELPIDILKTEFPADIGYEKDESKLLGYCQELNRASRLPWVLLSAGVSFEVFYRQAEIAFQAGASGFLAGRALWQEATEIKTRAGRNSFFETTASDRFKKLAELAEKLAVPWYEKMGSDGGQFGAVAEGWYQSY